MNDSLEVILKWPWPIKDNVRNFPRRIEEYRRKSLSVAVPLRLDSKTS
jgi:hypothetical protein